MDQQDITLTPEQAEGLHEGISKVKEGFGPEDIITDIGLKEIGFGIGVTLEITAGSAQEERTFIVTSEGEIRWQ